MLQSWFNIAVGLWLLLCGFIPSLQTPAGMISAGAVAMLFGVWGTGRVKSWQSTVNGIIGVWIFLNGVWFHLFVPWNYFIFGAALFALAVWNTAEHLHPSNVALR